MEIDYRLPLLSGIELPIPEFKLVAHSPTIKEIAFMGEENFFQAMQYLCLRKEQMIQDKNVLSSISNFQILMEVLEQSQDKAKKTAIITLLQIIFPKYMVAMNPNSILLFEQGDNGETVIIDNNNFEMFQEVIRKLLCAESFLQGDNITYNPGNEKAKAIAEKLMRGRQKVAEIKHGGKKESILARYVSILTVAQITSLDECLGLNLFQVFDLIERYNLYLSWNIDLKLRLAGGKPSKEVESWMKDLHPRI